MELLRLKRTQTAPPLFAVGMILAAGLVISLWAGTAGAAQAGKPFIGSTGIHKTTRELMEYDRLHPGPREPRMSESEEVEHELERNDLQQNAASPRVGSVPSLPPEMMTGYRPRGPHGFETMSPQTIGPNVRAATLSGFNPTNSFPPDCDGAIGPTQYVVGVNGRIVSLSKATGAQDGQLSLSTDNFFNSVRASISTSDPMVRYDRLSGRWFLSIINVGTPNRWLLGVSDAASNGVISGSTVWTFYFFVPAQVPPAISNSCLADYPSMGIDANAIYVGVDEFCPSFQQTDGFVIRKSSVLSGGPIVVTALREFMSAATGFTGPWAPRGVDNYDPNSTEGYFIGVDGNSYGTVQMRRVSNPGGTPTVSGNLTITVPTTDAPLHSPHLGNTGGTNGNIDALDDRFFHAHIRNQQLWTSHNIAVDNTGVVNATPANNTRDGVRWYQFDVPVGAGTPTIVQSGTVFTATANNLTTERNYTMPSIMVSGQGHAALGFTTAGTNERINCGTVGRLAGDPSGAMQTPLLLTASTTAYNPPNDNGASRGRRRWGDYSITTVDPIDDMSLWTVQMYCDTTNSYGVRVAKLVAPGPAAPSGLADLAPGNAALAVTLTGTSASGTGFFDPGPNLPGVPAYSHLAAAITVGAATGTPPSVVSATYVNPTTVNLVLNTVGATPNIGVQRYTITITNPDGQTAAAAIVHVVDPVITASAGAGGSISPSGAVSVPYGTNQSFTITPDPCFSIANVLVDGSSVGAVASYTFNNVTANHTIAASFTAGLTTPVTALAATQVKVGNGGSGRTGITLTFTPPAGASSVEVYRLGYGNYPTYAGGSTPPAPGSYPPAGWAPTLVTASGQVDVPPSRDFWYYVAYGKNSCGEASPVSNVTAGTLDYHLGDVSDGFTPGTGDNVVNTADASLLGAHYGATGGALAGFEYLDVGPTTSFTTDGRPTADGTVDFEDLVMYGLNYTPAVSLVRPSLQAAATNSVRLKAPFVVKAGEIVDVQVDVAGAGNLQALSVALNWNHGVVTPIDVAGGELVARQGGVTFSPGPGRADAAMLGRGNTVAGEGRFATMRFRAIQDGEPGFGFARLVGRDAGNRPVAIEAPASLLHGGPVTATELYPVVPNPSRGVSIIECSLAARGPVELAVYSVDGRRVKTLSHGVQEAGHYHFTWTGADDHGNPVKAGLYFVRLDAPAVKKTRPMTLIR